MQEKTTSRMQFPLLRRTKTAFEFYISSPWGLSAVNGYRRAARHFGLHTLEDPTTLGTDSFAC